MTAFDSVTALAKKWDEEEIAAWSSSGKPAYTLGTTYRDVLSRIATLMRFKYVPYLNDEIQGFAEKLWIWLQQFELDEERRLAFKVASHILFYTEDQIRHLQEVCFQEKLIYRLLDEIILERGFSPYDYDKAVLHIDAKFEQCLLVPLTDSARYNQFVHVNRLENHARFGLKCLEVLVHPDVRTTPEVVAKLNRRYADRRILIVVEDFCGSGQTFTSDLARIAGLYPGIGRIYFCPYIITQRAEETIYRFARKYAPNVKLEILYGVRLSNQLRVFSSDSLLFSYEERLALKALCVKYHSKYFYNNRFIGKPRAQPYGFRNGQLLVVMQSNCPNHTLPIIWANDNGWQPLFSRVQRYA